MKRVSAIICVIMMAVALMAPAAFAAENTDDSAAAAKTDLELISSSPEDGATGVAVDNLSVKMRFNKDVKPSTDKIKKANAKQFRLVDSEGKKIPIKVYYSEKEDGLILVAADVYSGGTRNAIKGDEDHQPGKIHCDLHGPHGSDDGRNGILHTEKHEEGREEKAGRA